MILKVSSIGASTENLSQFAPGVKAVGGGGASDLAAAHLVIRALLYSHEGFLAKKSVCIWPCF